MRDRSVEKTPAGRVLVTVPGILSANKLAQFIHAPCVAC